MTCISKSVYIGKSDDIVSKCNNTRHSTIKMKTVDVKPNTYIKSSNEINNKYPKFQMSDIVRISKHKDIFAKHYIPNWSEKVFVIKNVQNTGPFDICY